MAAAATHKPARGWNSYDSYINTIDEEAFLANAVQVQALLLPHGYDTVTVDYFWYSNLTDNRNVVDPATGYPLPDPQRWPRGFAPVADRVHSMGLKFGVHVMRGISRDAIKARIPLTSSTAGTTTTTADIALLTQACPWSAEFFAVDTGMPEGRAWVHGLVRQLHDWGVDFLKIDCVFATCNQFDVGFLQAVSEVARPLGMGLSISPGNTAVSVSGYGVVLANAVDSLVDMYRVTDDVWDDYKQHVLAHFDVAAAYARRIAQGGETLAAWPDLDMLPLGQVADPNNQPRTRAGNRFPPLHSTRLSMDEQRTLFTLWCFARSPLIFGGDLAYAPLDDFTLRLLTDPLLLRIQRDSFANAPIPCKPALACRAWVASLSSDEHYVALFNTADEVADVLVFSGALAAVVPAHGVVVLPWSRGTTSAVSIA